ncbi:hypothetical protein C8J56DRAFT_886157 [Mycena floridula]|nr:hypothetical protein C8J56DRAFT_886157 [Mycena floridula]
MTRQSTCTKKQKSSAAKTRCQQPGQAAGSADNPFGPSQGNTTGGSSTAAMSQETTPNLSQNPYPEYRHRLGSSSLSSVPSTQSIQPVLVNPGLSTIAETESAHSEHNIPRDNHAVTSREDQMSENARRLHRAEKQRHHGAKIPKGLDNVEIQEAIFRDARRRSETIVLSSSGTIPVPLVDHALSSMSNIIRTELNGRLSKSELNTLENRLSSSGLIEAAIRQLHAPQGESETDKQYTIRGASLFHLNNTFPMNAMSTASTINIEVTSPLVDPPAVKQSAPIGDRIPTIMTTSSSVFDGPPSWRGSALPTYSINPRDTETLIVVPIADPFDHRDRPQMSRPARAIRLRHLFMQAGAGNIDISANDLNSESSDAESEEEIERIREIITRNPLSTNANSTNSAGINPKPQDILPGPVVGEEDMIHGPPKPEDVTLTPQSILSNFHIEDMENGNWGNESDSSIHEGSIQSRESSVMRTFTTREHARLRNTAAKIQHQAQMEDMAREDFAACERHRLQMEQIAEDVALDEARHAAANHILEEQEEIICQNLLADAALRRQNRRANRVRDRSPSIAIDIPAVEPEIRVGRNSDFIACVALQHTRFNHLREFGNLNIEDQGIGFDMDGNPFERERNAEQEHESIVMYFLRNNLEPGLAFGPGERAVNDRNVPACEVRRETPPHMQENISLMNRDIRLEDHDNGSHSDDSDPSDNSSDSGYTDNTRASNEDAEAPGQLYPEDIERESDDDDDAGTEGIVIDIVLIRVTRFLA